MDLLKYIDKTKLKKIKKESPIIFEVFSIIYGFLCYKRLEKQIGLETKIILFRGATGDNYLQCLLLDEYIKQHEIQKYIVLAMPGAMFGLSKVFRVSDIKFISVYKSTCIQRAYLFMNGKGFNCILPFYWEKDFGFTYNRCQTRMLPQFNFMDTYVWFSFNIEYPLKFRIPSYEKVTYSNEFFREKIGLIPNKTVLLSPYANSVTGLPIWFWNSIISELHEKGYKVLINSNFYNYLRAPNFFPSNETSVVCLNQGGFFLGVRSGFCDIISTSNCKKIILYPEISKKIDISNHRSESEFSSLRIMGLVDEADNNLIEITTPLIRNITDKEMNISGTEEYFVALEKLHKQILSNF